MTVRKGVDVMTAQGVRSVTVIYETTDFSKNPQLRSKGAERHMAVPFLVMYDHGKIYVDKRAPEWYQELAALHEMICCGGQFSDFAEFSDDSRTRCASVEKFILEIAGEHADEYRRKRRDMFQFLVNYGLCSIETKATFEETLKLLY